MIKGESYNNLTSTVMLSTFNCLFNAQTFSKWLHIFQKKPPEKNAIMYAYFQGVSSSISFKTKKCHHKKGKIDVLIYLKYVLMITK